MPFADYSINNILYQRGVYPAESFKREKRYGLSLWQITDEKVAKFIAPLLEQVNGRRVRALHHIPLCTYSLVGEKAIETTRAHHIICAYEGGA
jgi:hypothetical protein